MRRTVLGSDSTPTNPTANTLLAALPSDLRAVMKSVTKYSDNVGRGSTTGIGPNVASSISATTDHLPLLAEFEVFGTHSNANSYEQDFQAQYDYYKAANSKLRYKYNDTSTGSSMWLRSVMGSNAVSFCTSSSTVFGGALATDASADFSNSYNSSGVSPLFAV